MKISKIETLPAKEKREKKLQIIPKRAKTGEIGQELRLLKNRERKNKAKNMSITFELEESREMRWQDNNKIQERCSMEERESTQFEKLKEEQNKSSRGKEFRLYRGGQREEGERSQVKDGLDN